MLATLLATAPVAAVSACARLPAPVEPTGVLKPPRASASPDQPLTSGLESLYSLVNTGNLVDADAILRDVWRVPRFEPVALPNPLTWREDPYGVKYWRFVFFSLRPTTNLLWAFYRTGDRKYVDKLCAVLRSLVAFQKTKRTTDTDAFDDRHALAFRAMVLVNTYVKLRRSGDLPPDLAVDLLGLIATTAANLSDPRNFEATFNHGFNQATALLLVHQNFPALDLQNHWRDLAFQRLLDTAQLTIDADGAQIEKSPFYHFYEMSFGLELEHWARTNAVKLPETVLARLSTMIRYGTYILWPDGSAPLLGSSVRLYPIGRESLYADLMRDNPEFAFALTAGAKGTPPRDRAVLFRQSGQAILRSPIEPGRPYASNSQLLMDAGAVQGEHSHEEALAFNYYSGGRELIVDSGLNTYNAGSARAYFHSTSAHNTIVVDGRTQGSGTITPGLTVAGDGWAYQSGVANVYTGVTHRRSVLLLAKDLVLVVDSLVGAGAHTYDQLWHLFPGARTLTDGTRTRVYDAVDQPALDIVQGDVGAARTVLGWYGDLNPMQGWYSENYGEAQPVHVAGYRTQATSTAYLTLIASGPYAGRPMGVRGSIIGASVGGGTVDASICVDGFGSATVHIERQAAAGEGVSVKTTTGCAHVD